MYICENTFRNKIYNYNNLKKSLNKSLENLYFFLIFDFKLLASFFLAFCFIKKPAVVQNIMEYKANFISKNHLICAKF